MSIRNLSDQLFVQEDLGNQAGSLINVDINNGKGHQKKINLTGSGVQTIGIINNQQGPFNLIVKRDAGVTVNWSGSGGLIDFSGDPPAQPPTTYFRVYSFIAT